MSPLLIGAFVLVLVLLVAYFAYNQGKRQSKAHPKSLPTRNNATPVRQTTPRQTSANRPATSALQQRSSPAPSVTVPRDDHTEQLYRNLLKKAFGDKTKVERLIKYESTLAPVASRTQWIQSAIERWERDNR